MNSLRKALLALLLGCRLFAATATADDARTGIAPTPAFVETPAPQELASLDPLPDPTEGALNRADVMISEFMADNDVALYDDDCDRSDWIEIHNGGDAPVDLEGWSLTDDPADPVKWVFPAYTLESKAYLIVFASQKNKTKLPPRACRTRSNSMAGFHTNFRLGSEGEYLALVAPDGEVVSAFAPSYPPQRRDVSYGRVPGSPEWVGYMARPTPRAPNADTGDGFAPDVRFSKASAPFLHPFLLTLSTPEPDAAIRFTTDGSFPSETNARLFTYVGPIAITNTTQVRARTYQAGLLPGALSSETFLRLTNDPGQLASFTSTLPIVVITTLRNAGIGASVNTPVHFSVFEPRDGRTTLLSQPTLTTRGGIKTRGSSTGGQPQSNFAVEWWDELNQDKDLPVLGMPEDSEWVLYAPNEFDAALIHNPFTMELSRQMNFAAPRTRFVEVYLNKGGHIRSNDWFGLYVLMEKPGLSKNRIDAPKAAPEDVERPEVTGSYLLKTDRLDPGDTGFSAGGAVHAFVEPREREMKSPQRAPQLAYLTQYFRDLDNALRPTNPDLRDPVRGYRGFIELTNWVDFHMLELLSGQVDAIRLSTHFYKRRNGKVEYGPRWDYDRAWESKGDSRDDNPRVWDTGGGLFQAPWWNRVLADRDAWQLWIDRWQAFRETVFARENMFRVMDAMTNEIRSAQPRENRRWTATAPRVNYPNEIRIMKNWISNRLAWIDSQLAQPPRLSSRDARVPSGFLLSMDLPTSLSHPTNAAIFFTLDGTDPRPSRGTSAPIAFRYTAPIPITTNTRVIARVRDNGRTQRTGPPTSSTWSSPVIATFVVDSPTLLLTELMFHPEPAPSEPGFDPPFTAGDFEFLELMNAGDHEVDLAGCEFTRGIGFRFTSTSLVRRLAPGARLLLVRNRIAFLSRYPGAGPIAGEFDGNLADEGERVTLVGPAGETVFDVTYSDRAQPAADGLGFSLVLVDESFFPSELEHPSEWRMSAFPGGSPGEADPNPAPQTPHVLITELMASPLAGEQDWIELFNPDDRDADIGGWWLTDDLDTPKQARIPLGWRIPPKGYLVIPAWVFDFQGPGGFAFNSGGDSVWLLAADPAGNLTGWVHGFDFGQTPRGTSLGRHVTSDGQERFIAQTRPSKGIPNTGPQTGPLVISEFAVRRSLTGAALGIRDAFIELVNTSTAPVAVVDPFQPNSGWRLRGDVEFDFAENFRDGWTLEPGARIVLVGFDPTLDRFELGAFRSRYALPPSIPVLGPWRGNPDPGKPTLRVLPPGVSGGFGTSDALPVQTDLLTAASTPPWPNTGFASGASLSRRDVGAFAGDGANWASTTPTPGEQDDDLDGLPDDWEIAHGLNPLSAAGDDGPHGDPDRDAFTNAAEFRNQTDPRDPASAARLRILASAPGRITCLLDATPDRVFVVERVSLSGAGGWEGLGTVTTPAEGTIVLPIVTQSNRAYLLRVRSP